jgi:hypothetical protein
MWVVKRVVIKKSKKIHSIYTTDYLDEKQLKAKILL